MNIMEVNKRLRQRPPFQMIERVLEITPGESARGIKNVSVNEPYFMGHFPGAPIMPGVLIIESCAQLCSIVADDGTNSDALYVLLKVDGFKFVRPVIPGDTLDITVTKLQKGGILSAFDAVVKVDGAVRAKGTLTFAPASKDKIFGED